MKVTVHAANIHDGKGVKLLLPDVPRWFERLQVIWADQGNKGDDLLDFIFAEMKKEDPARKPIHLEVVKRTTKDEMMDPGETEFHPKPLPSLGRTFVTEQRRIRLGQA